MKCQEDFVANDEIDLIAVVKREAQGGKRPQHDRSRHDYPIRTPRLTGMSRLYRLLVIQSVSSLKVNPERLL